MRVVHVGLETPTTRAGGLNRYLVELLRAQRDGGLDATAVVLGDAADAAAWRERGVVVAGPASGSLAARAARIDRALRALGPVDLADLHFAGSAVLASTVGALRGVPKVVHFQGPWAEESAATGATRRNVTVKRAIERMVYGRADRVITLTGAFARVAEDRYGVAPWAVRVVAPGVDLIQFSPGSRSAARARVGAPDGPVVVAVRRLVPRMGLDVLIDAWATFDPAPDALLVIVGEGPERARLEQRAARRGVAARVRFAGHVADDELVEWYRAADATVVPSVALEGFGLTVLESVACGTPVVGTDAAGLAEALELAGQRPGVAAGDAAALADALRRVLDEGRDEVADARRRSIAERHGWSAVASRHRSLYEEVLERSAPLRIVVVDHTAVLSGGELAISRAIGAVGGEADVHAILATDGPLTSRLEAAGATVEVMALAERARGLARGDVAPGPPGAVAAAWTAAYVVRLARRLRVLRPDVVHTNSLKSALYGGAASRLAGVPCVWHVRDRIEAPYLPARAVGLVRGAARVLPSVVVANSASTLATLGVPGRVVASPLDESIDPTAPHAPGVGPLRVGILGRLAPWKGQHLVIGAFADAFPDGDETLEVLGAALFGEDEYADSLRGLAKDLGIEGRVRFQGFVDDVAGALRSIDVVVHGSVLAEPFGQVVIEAMGAGCAVVAADAGGPADMVTDGVDGLMYAMGDRAELAAALRRLSSDAALRARLGAAAQRTAEAYTPAALAPLLVAAWQDAAHAATRGGARSGR